MKNFFWPNFFFCNFKNDQKSIFDRLKLPKKQFHGNYFFDLFDFTSFFAFLNFSGSLCSIGVGLFENVETDFFFIAITSRVEDASHPLQ